MERPHLTSQVQRPLSSGQVARPLSSFQVERPLSLCQADIILQFQSGRETPAFQSCIERPLLSGQVERPLSELDRKSIPFQSNRETPLCVSGRDPVRETPLFKSGRETTAFQSGRETPLFKSGRETPAFQSCRETPLFQSGRETFSPSEMERPLPSSPGGGRVTTYTAGRPDRGRHARTRTLVSVVGHCRASCSSCCWVRTSVLLVATLLSPNSVCN